MQFLIYGDPDFHCSGGSCLLHHQQSLQRVSGTQAGTQTCKRTQCTTHTDINMYRESDLSRLMQGTQSITTDSLETFQFCLATSASGQLPMGLSSLLARFRGLIQLPKKVFYQSLKRIPRPASFRSIKLNLEFDKEVLSKLLFLKYIMIG